MPHRIILTPEDVDRIAAEHLAGFIRLMMQGLTNAGADHLETGGWCREFLTHYDASGAATAGTPGGRQAGDRHLRVVQVS